MKVQIRDKEALESLTTANLRVYLEAQRWNDAGPWGERATIYNQERRGRLWEIAVPFREDSSDYAEIMAEAVTTLADAEDRSQLDVFYDLAKAGEDVSHQVGRKAGRNMPKVWCVRAYYGKYAGHFVKGGYAAIGWIPNRDLSSVKERFALRDLYRKAHPEVEKPLAIGVNVGQIARFVLDAKPGDYIITPAEDPSQLWYGRVVSGPYYDWQADDIRHNGHPWPHRRKVDWTKTPVYRDDFSAPFQNALKRAQLTVFQIKRRAEFLICIGQSGLVEPPEVLNHYAYISVMQQLTMLNNKEEFDTLIDYLRSALVFV